MRREVGDSVEFLVSSPSNGPLSVEPFTQRWGDANDPSFGDVHFYLYNSDLSDPSVFIDARFVSEQGFPSHSSYHATATMSLPADRYPTSPLMRFRNRLAPSDGLPDGLAILQAQLERHFRVPNATDSEVRFHHHLYLTQCVQAMHYQGFLEKYRRAQSGGEESQLSTQGVLFWMANEGQQLLARPRTQRDLPLAPFTGCSLSHVLIVSCVLHRVAWRSQQGDDRVGWSLEGGSVRRATRVR